MIKTILITILAVLAVRGLMLSGDKESAPRCLPGNPTLHATPSSEAGRASPSGFTRKNGALIAPPNEGFQL
ncbi:hypothetical protein QN382_19035 [Pseudomonas sp. 10B1]|uniref:hypothetical protein n=1 Tax=unclassified Pseudomonas TaxID=196821 RepID=UPI002B239DD1|nr:MULTISPECIES: hypothetical protein [unclassified Pseudomonas]MEA9994287.1 hypothetical protein [Pseudomonas sp. AA4]MEB0088536.1 hypothetical protein [Pseudomonas sp. RTI1]MEB0126541.1 hypothetical protein [Pseudomonas sp. CCC1.2]MEB0154646.1 hypothetical protein [Pseudomonas sp. CCC4.3]MEB0221137.1 hypothetical protein [Pseudomonas sp. AB12(2023)]